MISSRLNTSYLKIEEPFNMTIVGMNAGGKTYYLLEIIEKRHKGVFDYMTFICPTFSLNRLQMLLEDQG